MESASSHHRRNRPYFDFARALMAGISTHILAVHSFELIDGFLHGKSQSPEGEWLVVLASLAATILFALLLKHADQMHRPWPWLAVIGYLLLQWISDVAEKLRVAAEKGRWDWLLTVFALGCGALLAGAYEMARRWARARIKVVERQVALADPAVVLATAADGRSPALAAAKRLVETKLVKADALILFLSHLRQVAERNLPPGTPPLAWDQHIFADPDQLASKAAESGMGFHDLRSLDMLKHCNWYMQVKAIQAHVSLYPDSRNLDVIVVPSADEPLGGPGSFRQFAAFQKLIERLAAPRAYVIQVINADESARGVPYEDLEALSVALSAAKERLTAKADPDRLIVVDITSGKSTCSAVGAALTLEQRERIQYVSTTDLSVKLYDLEYEAPHSVLHG